MTFPQEPIVVHLVQGGVYSDKKCFLCGKDVGLMKGVAYVDRLSSLENLGEGFVKCGGSMSPNIPYNCNACGEPLRLENLYVDDGCPCNSARGVNFKPLPCSWCQVQNCVKPGHRLELLFGRTHDHMTQGVFVPRDQ